MRTAPRVLCISGSPRRDGNSDGLLEALITGVEATGGTAVRLVAASAEIAPCRGCHSCSKDGRCVIRDGMDDIYRLLDTADAIAVASPVFFATVPAVLKNLYDRCQPYWARRYVLREPAPEHKRPGAALVVGGGGDPFGAGCAITPTNSVFGVLGVRLEHVLEVIGPDEKHDIERFGADLERAERIGRSLVTAVPERAAGE